MRRLYFPLEILQPRGPSPDHASQSVLDIRSDEVAARALVPAFRSRPGFRFAFGVFPSPIETSRFQPLLETSKNCSWPLPTENHGSGLRVFSMSYPSQH